MAEPQEILDAHNRLCLMVSSALGSTEDFSQLPALKSEVMRMRQTLDEVRKYFLQLLTLVELTVIGLDSVSRSP